MLLNCCDFLKIYRYVRHKESRLSVLQRSKRKQQKQSRKHQLYQPRPPLKSTNLSKRSPSHNKKRLLESGVNVKGNRQIFLIICSTCTVIINIQKFPSKFYC